jgi:tetratricopeptide (TPR) repeat protein
MSEKGSSRARAIVIEKNKQARIILQRALARLSIPPKSVFYYSGIYDALEELKKTATEGNYIDLVITDIFFHDEYNIFRLLREMESIQALWNTPVILYTNESGNEMYTRVLKEVRHMPFRLIPKSNDENAISSACKGLIDYRWENRHYLETMTKVESYIETSSRTLLPGAIEIIDRCGEDHPSACGPERVAYLKGKLYYGIWKKKTGELDPLIEELEKHSSSSAGYRKIRAKIDSLAEESRDFSENAENHLLSAYVDAPENWEVMHNLFELYMDLGRLKEAKKYLAKLIEMFPSQTGFYHSMGKINELEGDFSGAVNHYLASARNAIEEGLSSSDTDDVMEIVDCTLEVTKKMLKKLDPPRISTEGHALGSEGYLSMEALQKTNAQVRVAMEHVAKKNPGDPVLYNKIGITYRRVGNYRMAVEMYQKALRFAPEDHRIRINYAAAIALTGSWEIAGKEAEEAKQIDSSGEDSNAIESLRKIIGEKDLKGLERLLV